LKLVLFSWGNQQSTTITMMILHSNQFYIIFCMFVLGISVEITLIHAWNFEGIRPAKSFNSRASDDEAESPVDGFTSTSATTPSRMISPLSRRQALSSIPAALLVSSSLVFSWPASEASARNMPVSNGADTSKVGTATALIPIVRLREDLDALQKSIKEEYKKNVDGPLKVISKTKTSLSLTKSEGGTMSATIPTVEKDFKRVFDAYSDQVSYKQKFLDQNAFLVYYTNGYDGPGRDNLEKDPVNERQTLQFGARNEAWIGWDDFLAEWEYYSSSCGRSNSNDAEESFLEIMKYLSNTMQAVDRYLKLSPPQDLEGVQQGNH